jgi:hypothetical protein
MSHHQFEAVMEHNLIAQEKVRHLFASKQEEATIILLPNGGHSFAEQ